MFWKVNCQIGPQNDYAMLSEPTHLLEFLCHSRGNLTISYIFISTSVIFCSCPVVRVLWLGILGNFYSKTPIQTVLYFSILLFEILT